MTGSRNTLFRRLALVGAIAFLAMGFLSLVSFAMPMAADGSMDMAHCPFMSSPAFCSMGPLDHVSAWHSVFSSAVRAVAGFALLALGAVALSDAIVIDPIRSSRFRLFEFSSPPPLAEAYSSGILNPKLF